MILDRFRALPICFFFFCSTAIVLATSVRTVNLTEMVELSDRVFLGKCLSAGNDVEEETGLRVSIYRFQVVEGLKGVVPGEILTVRQILGAGHGFARIAGLPQYRKGQEILLFLHPDSRLGLTSPVGMTQGTFHRVEAGDGDSYFVNAVQNSNLGYQIGQGALSAAGLSSDEIENLRSGGPIRLQALGRMVEKIDQQQQNRKEEAVQ